MLNKIRIYDVDGTLVDSSHRFKRRNDAVDIEHWHSNRHKVWADRPLPLLRQYQDELTDPSVYTIIATARFMSFDEYEHMESVLGMPDHLISRTDRTEQYTSSELKIAGLKRLLSLKQFARIEDITFFEDTYSVLQDVTQSIPKIRGIYVESSQGCHT